MEGNREKEGKGMVEREGGKGARLSAAGARHSLVWVWLRLWVGANGGRRSSSVVLVIGGWGVVVSMGARRSSMGDHRRG